MSLGTSDASDTRERLILTAERLFATEGIESVSLRAIARAGGQKNVAALQYHFSDRQGLLSAILEYRMSGIESKRGEMLAECDARGEGQTLRALIACLVTPFVEHMRSQGEDSHYIEFLARLQVSYPDYVAQEHASKPWQTNVMAISRRLQALAECSDSALVFQRQRMMGACLIQSVAEFERGLRSGAYAAQGLNAFRENLTDALCGLLAAPYNSSS